MKTRTEAKAAKVEAKAAKVEAKAAAKAAAKVHSRFNFQVPRGLLGTPYRLANGIFEYAEELPPFASKSRSIAGAVGEVQIGATVSSRPTVGGVAGGAIIGKMLGSAGAGAVVGSQFQADASKVYLIITWPDGEVVEIVMPAQDEPFSRMLARNITAAGRFYSETGDAPEPHQEVTERQD